ncbi:leucine-rich repeat neuronal protein 4 [Centropristis striata]|uniref:leucine-rich repeat neuronal protein 4 n=1 Tax=Centropristis striata TaxID=184440 RepID=UPI0027DEDA0F|nr:leucine-rich repeat neuronal protein 4 [Centropristis striata]
MTSLCRNPAVLLLFLSAWPLLNSHLFTHAATIAPPATRRHIVYTDFGSDDTGTDYDYDNYSHSPATEVLKERKTTLVHQAPHFCNYDPCLENQEPCVQIKERTGCHCPGVSSGDRPPHSPRIHALLPISDGADRGKIAVQWCAPSSVVSKYRVVIEGSEALEFVDSSRRGVVESLEVGTKVCVEAVNSAGSSPESKFSCERYDPPHSSDHKMLVGIIGGGVAVLLILVIAAVIFWQHQIRKKAKRDSADGLGNPSYSTEGAL